MAKAFNPVALATLVALAVAALAPGAAAAQQARSPPPPAVAVALGDLTTWEFFPPELDDVPLDDTTANATTTTTANTTAPHGARRALAAQAIGGVIQTVGSLVSITESLANLWRNNGHNIRSSLSVLGCLDGGFEVGSSTLSQGSLRYTVSCPWGACPYTVGYWDTCNSSPWQKWVSSEGKLWTTSKCFGAHRCMDAPYVTSRDLTNVCALDCWGGAGQEMTFRLSGWSVNPSREPLFFIHARARGTAMCLTYLRDRDIVAFTRCGNYYSQLWFIPGVLRGPSA